MQHTFEAWPYSDAGCLPVEGLRSGVQARGKMRARITVHYGIARRISRNTIISRHIPENQKIDHRALDVRFFNGQFVVLDF